jgi:hypothetical protein
MQMYCNVYVDSIVYSLDFFINIYLFFIRSGRPRQ